MAEAAGLKRKSTAKSGLGILLIVAAAVIAIGLAVYALTIPGVFESLVSILLIVAGAIVVIALVVYAIMIIVAVPMYIAKGEQVQEGVEYGLDDVKPVENSSSDDPRNR
ncbi:MAG: hypothetical protein IKR86_05260 [Candidatus Methanomethylophilaceae archaeon]|nr:hypothetical protein [Candidatus Methanomethylophilaceae archaeon]